MNKGVRIELLALANGHRLPRFKHAPSGLSLEKRLDENAPIVTQTGHWKKVFSALLAREMLAV